MGTNFRHNRFYIDHLVFSLHFHAFVFLLIALIVLLGMLPEQVGQLAEYLYLLIPAYALFAIRNFNGQGWGKSLVKVLLVLGAYTISLIAGTVAFFLVILFV
jgi:hypothetical protein